LQLFYRCALWNLAILATETNKCDLICREPVGENTTIYELQ